MDSEFRVLNNRHEAIAALRELEHAGVPKSSITIMSSEPLHLEPEGGAKSRIPIFGIIGGLLGAGFAILLTVWTSRRVGLVTGGMPIVSPWAFGIIVFELAALGAILMTLARMVLEARLARRGRRSDHGEMVADGKIVIEIDQGSKATKG
jgi:Alternative complex III, ActD subunit